MKSTCGLTLLFLIFLPAAGLMLGDVAAPFSAAQEPAEDVDPKPVADSMHHFMEYVFEPNFKRLKTSMANEPAEKAAWRPVKEAALTLAEGGNLLLLRSPEKNGREWDALSDAVRKSGGTLYGAARKADYKAAQSSYVTLIKSCNACHQKFAEGKHQLEP